MDAPVYLVANGARTPLGLYAAASAAAYRAAISAAASHPHMIDRAGNPMPAAMDSLLDIKLVGPQRLLLLAQDPLREACGPLSVYDHASRLRLPLFLGLPEPRPGFSPDDALLIRTHIAQTEGLPADISEVLIATHGHAAGLAALSTAAAQIRQGHLSACLAGGIDSYFHPDTMEWLDENRRLLSTIARSGFVPGEAAGFCLLMNEQACRESGLQPLALVSPGAMSMEPKHIKSSETCLGEGLSAAVSAAIANMPNPSARIDALYCDQNGERYRGEEWGFVCLRLGQHFEDPTAYHSPADCWGDVGAASGPLFAMLVCQANERGYAAGPHSMLCASSEGGMRSAIVISNCADPNA